MSDLYKSRCRISYAARSARTGAVHEVVLCDIGMLLTAPVTYEGSVDIQRSSVIGSRWLRQRSTGNASVTLSFAVASIHADTPEAEGYGEDLFLFFLLNPVGTITVSSSPDIVTGDPLVSRTWEAGRDKADPSPMTLDKWYGGRKDDISDAIRYAWLEMSYQFTLTRPDPEFPSLNPLYIS